MTNDIGRAPSSENWVTAVERNYVKLVFPEFYKVMTNT